MTNRLVTVLLSFTFLTACCIEERKEPGSTIVTTSLACETDQCIIDAVKATGDGTLCREVKGYEEGYACTIAYAKAKNDSSVCDGLFNRGWQERCREALAKQSG
jgi:hypothetical protein